MIKDFMSRTLLGKVILVAQLLLAAALVALVALELAGVMETPIGWSMVLVSGISLLEAASQWKEQRSMATLCLAGAGCALLAGVVSLL